MHTIFGRGTLQNTDNETLELTLQEDHHTIIDDGIHRDHTIIDDSTIPTTRDITEFTGMWKCGNVIMDRQVVLYFSQLGISLSVLSLCMYNLVVHYDDCNNNQLYSGLLTMIIGIWTPSPKMKSS